MTDVSTNHSPEKGLHIALLSGVWYPTAGGGVVHARELAERLATNHDCTIDILTKVQDARADVSLPDDVNVIHIPGTNTAVRPLNEVRYTVGVIRHVRSHEYDIVHAHTNTATFPLQVLRVISDVPVLFTIHGSDLDFSVTFTDSGLDVVYALVRRLILKRFQYDAIISVSAELTDVLESYHTRVEHISNGVDVADFPESAGYGDQEILFVGRLRPKKNPDDAIRAMETVVERHPAAKLHIVGTGPLRETVEQAVVQTGLENSVTIHGRVSEEQLLELYERCSLFVLPSEWEGHPLVLLEAWASGMIVVGTDVEGIREFVEPGSNGELVPLNDPPSLGETIGALLDTPPDLEERGSRAREHVATNFRWDDTVAKTYDLYRSLAGLQKEASDYDPNEVQHVGCG